MKIYSKKDYHMNEKYMKLIQIDFRERDENNVLFKHSEKSFDCLCVKTTTRSR